MPSPFKFLDAYTKADRSIFFGRDREIEEMYQKVFESKILLIYGISGTGKTSLINCGLANKFEDTDWLPVNVRRGVNIVDSLWKELGKVAITTVMEEQKGEREGGTKGRREGEKEGMGEGEKGRRGEGERVGVLKALQSIYLDHFKPIYLIFDQFEELFIFGNREEREEFIKIVKGVVDSDVQCKFIFSIREEYLAGVTEFELTIPDFLSNRMRIEKMTRQHAIEAIEGPCKVHGIEVEKGFPESLLDKLNPEGKDVELTYLQVFLDKVYRLISPSVQKGKSPPLQGGDTEGGAMETPDLRMTLSLLGKIGDVSDLLGSFLEEQIGELEDPATGLVVLKAFVSLQGTKKQIGEEEIADFAKTLGKPIDKEQLTDLLRRFVNLRVLKDKDDRGRYELRHDSLATKIYEKITLVEKELLEIKNFLDNAYQNFERRGVYLIREDLKYIAPYEDKLFLNKQQEKFLINSKSLIEKARIRRRNIVAATAIILLVIFASFTIWALTERRKAVHQTYIAEQQKNEAIRARDEANKSRQEAEVSKNEAFRQKALADSALIIAESERNIARNQKNVANKQRGIAESLYIEANEQKKLAEEAQKLAEESESEVLETSREALLQLYLFNANEFANRSLLTDRDDTLKALLALSAYDLFNYGYENYSDLKDEYLYDIKIVEALQKAYLAFEKDTLPEGEIWAMDLHEDLLALSNEGNKIVFIKLKERDYSSPELQLVKSLYLDFAIKESNQGQWMDYSADKSIIRSLSIDESHLRFICGATDGDVFLVEYDMDYTFPGVRKLYSHNNRILSVAFLASSDFVASSSINNSVIIWDLQKSQQIRELVMDYQINKIIDVGNNKLMLKNEQGNIFILDISKPDQEPVKQLFFNNYVYTIAFNKQNQMLAAACPGEVLLIDLKESEYDLMIRYRFNIPRHGKISAFEFSNDGKWLTLGFLDGYILLWDVAEERLKEESNITPIIISNPDKKIISLVISEDNKYIYYSDMTGLVLYPLSYKDAYFKLDEKLGGRTLTEKEWATYSRGNIINPRE